MNKVTRKMGKVVCSLALAMAIFAMPTASMAVEAAGYESVGGEMENVQATVGDGSITFKWTWNPDFLANGYGEDDDATLLSYYTGHDYNGAEAYVLYIDEDSLNDDAVAPEVGVNTWIVAVPTSTTTWTYTGLQNGTDYIFNCYYDPESQTHPILTPVASPVNNTTDDVVDNTPVVTPSEDVEENDTPVVTPNENSVVIVPVKKAEIPEGPSPFETQMNDLESQIFNAEDGAVVKLDGGKDMHTLPNSIMQTLYRKGTVSLEFTFEYEDQKHVVVIPAGKAKNADIPWYGPLYLLANYAK